MARGGAGFLLGIGGCTTSARSDNKTPVDLLLVLAIDVSGSVNHARFEMQRRGYVDAFKSPRVLRAIQSGMLGRIAITMVQWTGPNLQVQVVPWTLITGEDSVLALAQQIEAAPRQLFGGGTSISGVIDYASALFPKAPYLAPRQVIDVSGDGANNRGRPAAEARDEAVKAGIAINGLPILEVEPDLETFYRNNVIGGPNAFVIAAASFAEFGEAILKKLVTEIADKRQRPIEGSNPQRPG